VGPVLMGSSAPVHIMNPSATVRRLVNMIALAAANAGVRKS
jgi:malate dehydrogenase (oxaloacetate-decarboxylating)(NADP+)